MSGLDNFRLNVRFSVCTKPFVTCTDTLNSQLDDFQINLLKRDEMLRKELNLNKIYRFRIIYIMLIIRNYMS